MFKQYVFIMYDGVLNIYPSIWSLKVATFKAKNGLSFACFDKLNRTLFENKVLRKTTII
jgi:hypothetical protein